MAKKNGGKTAKEFGVNVRGGIVSIMLNVTSDKSLAERAEEIAAGRSGSPCPFCGSRATSLLLEVDRQGILEATWQCNDCDETGACLLDGTMIWSAE